ncbi:universal stress protein [Mycoplana rhizolycopersici]|uniref:Universal stress protein n=1 Tax=Mycoplana rhizolycopersici TaxID=2746702 RepID=A0ABX2QMN6_9HYPH|nr:universal stress protein [Rhizobium rhizolycopersici]NVP58646.1 universal stress protein [Rhizobium rhizolycopersici]
MRYKTILSVIGVNDSREDLANAIVMAQAIGAHLSVVVIAMAAPPPIGAYAEAISPAWLEERQGDLAKLEGQTLRAKDQMVASGLSFDIQDVYSEFAWAADDIARRALYADLTLVGRGAASDERLCRKIVDGALFQAIAPMLVNPTERAFDMSPETILVAWDSRMEAARAVQQALPLLRHARDVRVVLVDPVATQKSSGEDPGADIAANLARHGAAVTVDVMASGGKAVADVLKQHATDVGAGLVVMGAYSHSRLRERVFGGVTRSMLETTNVPLFLSH